MTYRLGATDLLARAATEWDQISQRWPHLESAVSVQRRLVSRSLDLGQAIDERLPVDLSFQPARLAEKLRVGTPMLAGEWVVVTSSTLRSFVIGFCTDLEAGETGGPAGRLGGILARNEIDAGSLVAASIGRQQEAIRAKAHHVGVAPDLLWLVAELASAPIANRLQQTFTVEMAAEHPELESRIAEWDRGFCSVCGSWPAFAEHSEGEGSGRGLRCSFCGIAWNPGGGCIYCQEGGETLITAVVDPERPSRRLELCRQCGGYLKCLDVPAPTPFELLAVEDLDTHDLDIGAAERGYSRPSLPTFTAGDVPCPPVSTE